MTKYILTIQSKCYYTHQLVYSGTNACVLRECWPLFSRTLILTGLNHTHKCIKITTSDLHQSHLEGSRPQNFWFHIHRPRMGPRICVKFPGAAAVGALRPRWEKPPVRERWARAPRIVSQALVFVSISIIRSDPFRARGRLCETTDKFRNIVS